MKIRSLSLIVIACIVGVLSLFVCFHKHELPVQITLSVGLNKPSEETLKNRLAAELPHFLAIKSFGVEVSENVGTKVEPCFKSRFKAEVEASQDTFVDTGSVLDSHQLLVQACIKGTRRALYGVATSVRDGESWETGYEFESSSPDSFGQPRSAYSGQALIKGSPEEAQVQRTLDLRIAEEARAKQLLIEKNAAQERRQAEQLSAFKMPQPGQSSAFAFDVYPDEWSATLQTPTNYRFEDGAEGPEGTRYLVMVNGDPNRVYACKKGADVDFGNAVFSLRFKSGETKPVKVTMKFTPTKGLSAR